MNLTRWVQLSALCAVLALLPGLLAGSPAALAQNPRQATIDSELLALEQQRDELSTEIAQYESTISLLRTSKTPASAVTANTLANEVVALKRRIIRITEREVQLLQEKIGRDARREAEAVAAAGKANTAAANDSGNMTEDEVVTRLLILLQQYYAELDAALAAMPDPEEQTRLDAAARDAANLSRIPYSPDKVRLSGAEGASALARIAQRLTDDTLPEARRDIAPIASIRTRLMNKLISSENRSLAPIGKQHYVARIRLQPGDTQIRVRNQSWDVLLPDDISSADYLVTLYSPSGSQAEMHVIAIDELLALEPPYVPEWLPPELGISVPAQ